MEKKINKVTKSQFIIALIFDHFFSTSPPRIKKYLISIKSFVLNNYKNLTAQNRYNNDYLV